MKFMWTPSAMLVILEAGLGGLFLGFLANLWKELPTYDAALWAVVWCTRVLATANGARGLTTFSVDLGIYMSLQACSGLALIVVLSRLQATLVKARLREGLGQNADGQQTSEDVNSSPGDPFPSRV